MARPGPAQSASKIGRTPNAGWTEVPNTPFDGDRPALESWLPDPLPQVATWWSSVSVMPHCRLWSEADWLYALDTALHKQACYSGDASVAQWTEARRREDQMGTTVEARRKLGIRYVDPPAVDVEPNVSAVASLDDRRARLNAS